MKRWHEGCPPWRRGLSIPESFRAYFLFSVNHFYLLLSTLTSGYSSCLESALILNQHFNVLFLIRLTLNGSDYCSGYQVTTFPLPHLADGFSLPVNPPSPVRSAWRFYQMHGVIEFWRSGVLSAGPGGQGLSVIWFSLSSSDDVATFSCQSTLCSPPANFPQSGGTDLETG